MRKTLALKVLSGAIALWLLLAGNLSMHAQAMPKLAGTPEDTQQTETDDRSVDTLKVNVDVVQLFFNVKDKKGGLIPNLTKEDFEIAE